MNPIIDIEDVSFSYRETREPALNHISLAIGEGDFLGIIGPSGAGKSTLAACLSGAIPHHFGGTLYGAAHVAGKDTCEVTLTDISRIVGSVLQDIDTQMVASVVEDELLFGMENFGVPHDTIEQRLSDALQTVGIADLRDREIATLSGGQKQKVAIAAIMALQPRVLVLDEPTAALDPASSLLVFDTLAKINREQNVTVVVIEQKVALLSTFCNRVVVLDNGKIALEGTPHEVFSHAEELQRIGVDSPRVARISNSLARKNICSQASPCLTVDEAETLIERVAGNTSHNTSRIAAPSPHAPRAATAQNPVVAFEHVDFAYPLGGAAVHDLTLEVRPGELIGLVGQNGAGKTTFTKLLTGLLKPDAGSVRIAGADTKTTPTSVIARSCATLFQNPDRQICKETVEDEIAFGLELHGMESAHAHERAREAAQRFGLPLDEAPFSLSRGQRQMVALASVLVVEPRVIVLDEPTSGLDYRECMTVMETVKQMAESGCAVIMVCHDMEVVSDFAERIAVMADGRILASGPSRDLFAQPELMRAASIEPPQVIELARRLSQSISPAFEGVSEVSDIVRITEEMVHRG